MSALLCSQCAKPIASAVRFYPYALAVVDFKPDDPVPLFCGEGCVVAFVSERRHLPVCEVMEDLRHYRESLA